MSFEVTFFIEARRRAKGRFNIPRKRFGQRNMCAHFHKMKVSSLEVSQRHSQDSSHSHQAISDYTLLTNPRENMSAVFFFFALAKYMMLLHILTARQNCASHIIVSCFKFKPLERYYISISITLFSIWNTSSILRTSYVSLQLERGKTKIYLKLYVLSETLYFTKLHDDALRRNVIKSVYMMKTSINGCDSEVKRPDIIGNICRLYSLEINVEEIRAGRDMIRRPSLSNKNCNMSKRPKWTLHDYANYRNVYSCEFAP